MLGVEVGLRRHTWHQLGQLNKATTIQRQLAHLGPVNDIANRSSGRFHLHRACLYRHHFGGAAGLKREVKGGVAGHV